MSLRKVMFTVFDQYKGVKVKEVFSASFIPKLKKWTWHDGKNNNYYVSSEVMKKHFNIVKVQNLKVCACGDKSYSYDDKHTCLSCIWKENGVRC